MKIENEYSLSHAISNGINIFVGAGFSIYAEDALNRKLPLGWQLLDELNKQFGKNIDTLPKLCTILDKTQKEDYRKYLTQRFSVKEIPDLYYNINNLNIKSIYTTNIDNLIPQIIQKKNNAFLNDQRENGESPEPGAINYLPLHGNVDSGSDTYIFDTSSLANIYTNAPRIWNYVSHSIEKYPTLFIGYSFNDNSVIQSVTSQNTFEKAQKEKWIVLYNPQEGDVEYFHALGFNVIISEVKEFLEYLPNLCCENSKKTSAKASAIKDLFKANLVPTTHRGQLTRPIIEFFRGMPPIWGDIMSNNIYKTSYYRSITNAIHNPNKNLIITGAPLSGKSTLAMQAMYYLDNFSIKLLFSDLTITKADYILKLLGQTKALIAIENFTDDVEAFLKLSEADNIKLIGIDRSHNFEIVSNHFSNDLFEIINVTELSDVDTQGVYDTLPIEIKQDTLKKERSDIYKDDSIFEFVVRNIKGETIKERYKGIVEEMEMKNETLAEFLILCAYMHYCRVPLSTEVAYSYFNQDYDIDFKYIYEIKEQLQDLLNEFEDPLYDLNIDYYYPRSYYFADTILKYSSKELLSKVIKGVINSVPQVQICNYNKFKKYAFDKELILLAFPDWKQGKLFYEQAYLYDYKNPYVLQQGALYLSSKKQYKLAFEWIDKAKIMTNNKYFSIRNSHAIILFEANYDIPLTIESEKLLDESMQILHKCFEDDQRKTFHAITFADQAIRYFYKMNSDKTIEYLKISQKWLNEELINKKWNYGIKRQLYNINNILKNYN